MMRKSCQSNTMLGRRILLWLIIVALVFAGGYLFRGWFSPSLSNPMLVAPYEHIYGVSHAGASDVPADADLYSCSWDGKAWVFLDETQDAIFMENDGEKQHILDWQEKVLGSVDSIHHVGDYLLICTSGGYYQYNLTDKTLDTAIYPINPLEFSFIYEDWIVSLWPAGCNQIVAYHVPSGERINLDIQRKGSVAGDFSTQVSYASDDRYLYISLVLREKFMPEDQAVSIKGTYAINLETWETQCLSANYYRVLRRVENGLWGNGVIPIKLPDDAP